MVFPTIFPPNGNTFMLPLELRTCSCVKGIIFLAAGLVFTVTTLCFTELGPELAALDTWMPVGMELLVTILNFSKFLMETFFTNGICNVRCRMLLVGIVWALDTTINFCPELTVFVMGFFDGHTLMDFCGSVLGPGE